MSFQGPDTFGPQTIPLPSLAAKFSGDPALYYILDYLKTFLVTDANATAQWTVSGVAPATPPVQTVFIGRPDDPSFLFNTAKLPILFGYRDGSKIAWWGDDWGVKTTQLQLVWVPPLGQPNAQASRLP